jgi:1-acyl-sn-glycerol-3-phosphate acyltransferase
LSLLEGIIYRRFAEVRILPWFYYVARVLVRMLFSLLTRWQVKGKENVPSQGPLLGVSLGRVTIFMAKEELFRSRFSAYFISSFGSFPVHRGKLDREAIRQAQQVLADGLALVMFPEASRSKSAQLQPAFPGSALIASRSDVPILPVGISGTERIKGIAWILRRPHITVNVGRPFYLPPARSELTRARLAEHTDFIMQRIAELLPPQYRGNYAGKETAGHED